MPDTHYTDIFAEEHRELGNTSDHAHTVARVINSLIPGETNRIFQREVGRRQEYRGRTIDCFLRYRTHRVGVPFVQHRLCNLQ